MKQQSIHALQIAIVTLMISFLPYHIDAAKIDPNVYYKKGTEELHKSNYNAALSNYLRFIQIEEQSQNKDKENLMYAYLGTGSIYNVYSDYEQALDFYFKGRKISIELKKKNIEFKFINNIIGTYCDAKKPEKAERYNEAIRKFKDVNKGLREEYYFFNKGFIAKSRGKDDKMVKYMTDAINCIDKYKLDKGMKLYPYSEIFMAYEREGYFEDALLILNKYYNLAKNVNQKYLVVDCYKGYMRLYTKLGDKEKALYYQDQYFKYSDSLLNMRGFNQVRSEYQAYEKYVTSLKIENLEKISSLQRKMLIIVLTSLLIAIVVAIVIFRQRQRLNIANIALYERNKELLEAKTNNRKIIKNENEKLTDKHTENDEAPYYNEELLEKINSVMEHEEIFCNPDFSLTMLAKMVDSNTYYVSQIINTTYNENFRTFIYEYRVRVAMKRLMDTERYGNYNIQGIAESVGYKSASNFISAFKKVTGMTPSLYQKIAKEERNQF